MVIELISCFGLSGLSALYMGRDERDPGIPGEGSSTAMDPASQGRSPPASRQTPSLRPVASGRASFTDPTSREASKSPSNILPMRLSGPLTALRDGASLATQERMPEIKIGSHVHAFVRERLETSNGSLSAKELRAAYEVWCTMHDHKPSRCP
jgi:hypothetical protein